MVYPITYAENIYIFLLVPMEYVMSMSENKGIKYKYIIPKVHYDPACFVVLSLDRTHFLNTGKNRRILQQQYPLHTIITGHEANLLMKLDDRGYPLSSENNLS